jgi:hypothetical protein
VDTGVTSTTPQRVQWTNSTQWRVEGGLGVTTANVAEEPQLTHVLIEIEGRRRITPVLMTLSPP